MGNNKMVEVSPEDRAEALEILKDYVNDIFAAFEDGRITYDELKEMHARVFVGAAELVIPDSVEAVAVPFLKSLFSPVWDKVDAVFRDEERLNARIAEAEAEGKTKKAARLREVLERIDD